MLSISSSSGTCWTRRDCLATVHDSRLVVTSSHCSTAWASLIESAYQRAVVGVEEPVFQGGKLVGTRRKYSDSIMRLMLERGIDPTKVSPVAAPAKALPSGVPTQEEVDNYIADNGVLINPLHYDNYPSIGCAPCTRRVADGEDPRSGRWAGIGKIECGIHL